MMSSANNPEVNVKDFKVTYIGKRLKLDLKDDLDQTYKLRLVTVAGQEILNLSIRQQLSETDMSHLPGGIYILNVYNEKNGSVYNQIIHHVN